MKYVNLQSSLNNSTFDSLMIRQKKEMAHLKNFKGTGQNKITSSCKGTINMEWVVGQPTP